MNIKEALKILVHNPFLVINDGIYAQKNNYHRSKIKARYAFTQLPTIDLLELIPGFHGTLENFTFLTGTSLITDLLLLKLLASTFKNCEYLEIGSWRGESISNVADVAKNCTAITLSDEEMRTMKFSADFIACHGIFSKGQRNIKTIYANSHTFDFSTLDKKYDLVFIDGDHSYEGVLNDSKKTFPLRKNKDSILVWHDYGLNTEDVNYCVLNGILDGIPKEQHKNLFHVSNTMCAIYIERKRFKTSFTSFPSIPNKKFSIELRSTKL